MKDNIRVKSHTLDFFLEPTRTIKQEVKFDDSSVEISKAIGRLK